MLDNKVLITGIVLLAVATMGGLIAVERLKEIDPMNDKHILTAGKGLPIIWVYYDHSDVNSRYWRDFMARSSRVINVPYLNLCYETIVRAAGKNYQVKVIGGLDGVADILGGWDAMPRPLQNPLASVKESEINWIRAAILKKYGGLWVSPSTIWLQPIGKLPKDKTVFFGMDDETPYADGQGTRTPGLRVVWSPKPDEPLWVEWEARAFERLDAQGGGRQIRHDDYSDAYEAAKAYGGDIEYRPLAERSRKGASGRRIEIEDILSNGIMPFDVTSDNLYVPVPWPELRDRSKYGWFLRMSEEQIMESNLTITALFHVAAACPSAAAK